MPLQDQRLGLATNSAERYEIEPFTTFAEKTHEAETFRYTYPRSRTPQPPILPNQKRPCASRLPQNLACTYCSHPQTTLERTRVIYQISSRKREEEKSSVVAVP